MSANAKKDGEPMRLRFGVGETFLLLFQMSKNSEVALVVRKMNKRSMFERDKTDIPGQKLILNMDGSNGIQSLLPTVDATISKKR